MKGKFITFEGSEGSGKSTQIQFVYDYLCEKKYKVLNIREPGATTISEDIRNILLDVKNKQMTKECEALLYMAARAQLVGEVIAPALEKGDIVLCDRYLDSTLVYQGYGCGIDLKAIQNIGCFATKEIVPDLTILFDIEVEKGLSRAGSEKDRIEQRSLDYHKRVREGYLNLAKKYPERIKVVPVDKQKEDVFKNVRKYIDGIVN